MSSPSVNSPLVPAGPTGRVVRWGILGCGRISHDFVNAIKHLADVEVVACAARDVKDAQTFAGQFDIAAAYGSYAELVADANVEVIYVGTLHPQHAEHTILALEAGKHVLCEKPFAITREEGQRMVDAARKTGRFLMEAMWTRFQPSIAKVRELIAEGVIGKPKIVEATFGFKMPPPAENPRLWLNKLAGGCMMDLSVYPLALANMIFGNGGKTPPTKIVATGELSEGEAIDIQESITLQYGPGQMAVLSASMLCTPANEAFIVGDKGVIHIQAGKSAWHASQRIAYKLTESNEWTTLDFTEPARADQKPFVYGNSQMMRHEAQEVMECIRTGKTESAVHCLDESLVILGIMDEARKQLGVVFEQDRK